MAQAFPPDNCISSAAGQTSEIDTSLVTAMALDVVHTKLKPSFYRLLRRSFSDVLRFEC
jgi:hypothetical protein